VIFIFSAAKIPALVFLLLLLVRCADNACHGLNDLNTDLVVYIVQGVINPLTTAQASDNTPSSTSCPVALWGGTPILICRIIWILVS
jgi:hypothetical protein